MQHRSHRKILISDDQSFITGGRNIANEYFGLSPTYNFLDTDILVEGNLAIHVRKSFDGYWNSDLAKVPEVEEVETDNQLFNTSQEAIEKTKKQLSLSQDKSIKFTCSDITFISDSPGVLLKNRRVYTQLVKILHLAEKEIVGESPYFVLREEGIEQIKAIAEKEIDQLYLTNGLRSTDAYYTVATLFPNLEKLKLSNLKLFAYAGDRPRGKNLPKTLWGIHSKRAIIDGRHTLIGTYNVDPRSANLNSELMIVCRDNPRLAAHMKNDIIKRVKGSNLVVGKQKQDWRALLKNATPFKILKTILVFPLSIMLIFLL